METIKYSESFFDNLGSKISVIEKPFPYAYANNFFPKEIIENISKDFKFPNISTGIEDKVFQKTKKGLSNVDLMPDSIKNLILKLNSNEFTTILEKKFNIEGLVSDPFLFGGGMHESFKDGFLKIHSDFIFIKKRKLKRELNLLIYLNENWDENWGGAIELWDQKMQQMFLKVHPHINNMVIFRTDCESNHGFPDPLKCPKNESRKSLALYYYTNYEKIIKPKKYYYARWKQRPGIEEKKFGDNLSFFKKLKNKFFFRF